MTVERGGTQRSSQRTVRINRWEVPLLWVAIPLALMASGVTFAFNGIDRSLLISIAINVLAFYIVFRMNPESLDDVLEDLVAYVAAYLMVHWLISIGLPGIVGRTNTQGWEKLADSFSGATIRTTSDPVPRYEDQTSGGYVPQIAEPQGGGSYADSPVGTTFATPITSTQLIEMQQLLYQAKGTGNISDGVIYVDSILSIDPQNRIALAERRAISDAQLRANVLSSLPTASGGTLDNVTIDPAKENEVYSLLRGGFSYMVVSSGAKLLSPSCKEDALLRDVTEGWTYGVEFRVARCYLSQFGVTDSGDVFFVGR